MSQTKLDRSRAPINNGAPEFHFPEAVRVNLESGIPVYCISDLTQPIVSVSLSFVNGAAEETVSGISRFAMRLLTRGSQNYSADEFAERIDALGASLTCGAGWDSAEISLHVLSDHIEPALDLMAEAALRPAFDTNEVDLLRRQTIADIHQILADADQLAGIAAARAIFSGHYYGRNRGGTLHSTDKFDAQTARDRYQEIRRGGCFFTVAGNCTPDDAAALLGKRFGELTPPATNTGNIVPEIMARRQVIIVDKPGAMQASLRMGTISVGHSHSDYSAVELACTALGGFFTARLNRILREEKGYTYGAFSFHDAKKYAATLNAALSVNHDATGESVKIVLDEIARMQHERIEAAEFSRARQYLMGVFARNAETTQQISQFVQTIKLFGLPDSYYSDFFRKVSSLTAEDVFAAQNRHFSPDNWAIIAVGESATLAPQLQCLGEPKIVTAKELVETDENSF
ncbi:hypothetical protein MASR2M18_13510 [Ignavibacteria bacterium]|nr:insulinase family protein [Bacteroidota bacterium]MCZ2132041.1 insulinase family protein [Bacteroidota bacterium]